MGIINRIFYRLYSNIKFEQNKNIDEITFYKNKLALDNDWDWSSIAISVLSEKYNDIAVDIIHQYLKSTKYWTNRAYAIKYLKNLNAKNLTDDIIFSLFDGVGSRLEFDVLFDEVAKLLSYFFKDDPKKIVELLIAVQNNLILLNKPLSYKAF